VTNELILTDGEQRAIGTVVGEARHRCQRADDPGFLIDAPVIARDLPVRVQHFLNRFRRNETGYCLIRGHTVDDSSLGPTPGHWNALPEPSPTLGHDLLLVLYSSLLGDPFGWATQQDGRLVHDVLPIKGMENEQLGCGSEALLTWHTEDAFHPYRPDWVILACLRNPDGAVTTIGTVSGLPLDPADVAILFQPRFVILPDYSHQPGSNGAACSADFGRIERLRLDPPAIPLLYGDQADPYITADPYFWRAHDDRDREARAAMQRLGAAMDAHLRGVALQPGDYCVIDNHKAVHGRRPFRARYDGTDRWLKRICVTRDLRKSRDARSGTLSQVIS